MAARKAQRSRRKPAKQKKKARVQIDISALTKGQRAMLKEVFGGVKVSVQGLPPPIGIVKHSLVDKRRKR